MLTDSGLKHGELLEQSTLASWSPAQRKGHRDGRPGDLPRSRVPVPSCWKPRGRRVRVHIRRRGLHLAFREVPCLLSSTHPPCSCASSSAFPSYSFFSASCLFLLPAHVSLFLPFPSSPPFFFLFFQLLPLCPSSPSLTPLSSLNSLGEFPRASYMGPTSLKTSPLH